MTAPYYIVMNSSQHSSSKNNSFNAKITLDQKNNGSVTLDYNRLTVNQEQFVKKGLRICTKEKRPFSFMDFKELSQGNFRQFVHKLSDYIERVGKSNPQFYKIKGVELPGDTRRITTEGMGVGEQFYEILLTLQYVQPMIHDIKVKVESNDLHTNLLQNGCSSNPSNNSIKVNVPYTDNNITTKIFVYPKTVQIDIGCTYRPIVYDPSGMLLLHEHLSKISCYLSEISGTLLPPAQKWIITQYHMNKDGKEELSGSMFNFTVEEVVSGMLRFYSKKMPDGKTIPRLEQIVTPRTSVADEMKKAMFGLEANPNPPPSKESLT